MAAANSFRHQSFREDHFSLDFGTLSYSRLDVTIMGRNEKFLGDGGVLVSEPFRWQILPEYPEWKITAKMTMQFSHELLNWLTANRKFEPFQMKVFLDGAEQPVPLIISSVRHVPCSRAPDRRYTIARLRFRSGSGSGGVSGTAAGADAGAGLGSGSGIGSGIMAGSEADPGKMAFSRSGDPEEVTLLPESFAEPVVPPSSTSSGTEPVPETGHSAELAGNRSGDPAGDRSADGAGKYRGEGETAGNAGEARSAGTPGDPGNSGAHMPGQVPSGTDGDADAENAYGSGRGTGDGYPQGSGAGSRRDWGTSRSGGRSGSGNRGRNAGAFRALEADPRLALPENAPRENCQPPVASRIFLSYLFYVFLVVAAALFVVWILFGGV